MPQIKIAIRVDAENETGGGHAYRCLALAEALADRSALCQFVTKEVSLRVVPALASSGQLVILEEVSHNETVDATQVGLRVGSVDLLIIDDYRLGVTFERAARSWAPLIATLDDAPNRSHEVDFLIDHNQGRVSQDYAKAAPHALIIAGSQYALLRRQFGHWREASLARRHRRAGRVERILVAFGATDPYDYTGTVLEILLRIPDIQIDVLVGALHPGMTAIRAKISELDSRARLLQSCDEVGELMASADLAIGGLGVMSWERCALGLPTVAVTMAENQRTVASALSKMGAAVCLGEGLNAVKLGLWDAVARLCSHPAEVVEMSRAAAQLCDGHGAMRTAEVLMTALRERHRRPELARL